MSAAASEPNYHLELIDDREVQKPVPKKLHAFIKAFLIQWLGNNLPFAYIVLPELNVLTGGRTADGRCEYVVPDVSVVPRNAVYEDGDLASAPVLAAEILSPAQTIADLFVRSQRLLKLGTPATWVIWPERRRAWLHTESDLQEILDLLPVVLPDGQIVQIDCSQMWAVLE